MADKNFARSGTGDTDLLADDDPLSELARLVDYEQRPVPSAVRPVVEPVEAPSRLDNPVLALEDELMRAFEQYDAPQRAVAEPVSLPQARIEPEITEVEAPQEEAPPVEAEPVAAFDPEPVLDMPDAGLLPIVEVESAVHAGAPSVDLEPTAAFEPEPAHEAAFDDIDAGLLLADEVETAVHGEAPAVEAEPVAFVERLEPRFETPVHADPALADDGAVGDDEAFASHEPEPIFLGLQPLAPEEAASDITLDLERELELSIGGDLSDALVAEVSAASVEPYLAEPVTPEPAFQPEVAYAEAEPHFVAEFPPHGDAEARALTEAQWQEEAAEPVFDAAPAYEVTAVERGADYDHDDLLAEVERFPVPEARSPLAAVQVPAIEAATSSARTGNANIASIFGRATPVASRETVRHEPVAEVPAMPVEEPVPVAEPEPVEQALAAEPEIDLGTFEIDLSDLELELDPAELELDPAELVLDEEPAVAEVEEPVMHKPAVAVPVSVYSTPPQPVADAGDGTLPFDPTMIAETDDGVTPVAELDVPQLPVVEKEKPPVQHPEYDFDIDAEMAQLFATPDAHGATGAAGPAAPAQTEIADADDFERALEEDFRRSLNQPERMAIPVDPGQTGAFYAGDGYGDEPPPARRRLLLAASVAALLVMGGGGVYAWMSLGGSTAGSGEPRVILADKEPVKIVPEERGGKTVPNQDKAVYDRVAGNTDAAPQQDQLVTSTEEPVDVVQRTLTPETLPFDGLEDGEAAMPDDDEGRLLPGVDNPAATTATAEDGRTPLVSPRKVRTMIVKPDGTLVAREETVAEPATDVATVTAEAASGQPVDADTSLRVEQAAAEARPRSALAEVADAEVDDTAPVRVVRTTAVGTEGNNARTNTPLPETRPIDQPVNVVGTVTENGNVSSTGSTPTSSQAAEQTQVAAATPGGYVIQIASLPSEAEAQKSYNTLSSRFGSVIGGRGVDIRKAEIPNKGTYYRVRIPAGSREEANALCSRYKSAGGSCLVTR